MAVKRVPNRKLSDLERGIAKLVKSRVLIGIPAAAGTAADGKAPLALIGYVMEHGDDEKRIPARPFLYPGVQDAQPAMQAGLRQAAIAACKGDANGVDRALNAVGLIGQNSVRAKMTDGPFVPLAEKTIEARARRGRKGAKQYLQLKKEGVPVDILNDRGVGLATPLIDTGALRRAVTYVVKK